MKVNKVNYLEITRPDEIINFLEDTAHNIEAYQNSGLGLDYLKNSYPVTFHKYSDAVSILFCGFEIILTDGGRYYINDTTGG